MKGWNSIEFSKCLIRHPVSRSNQINASEIYSSGKYPVIDQGQAFIAGYSNNERKVVRETLPYIIFGDHTRCFKYVDFPFILGADGTKVLKPNPDLFSAKFFYYALQNLNIPSRGYNRHFKLLKEQDIPHTEKSEQRRIAAILSTVQRAIEQQERLITLTTELKKSLMHKLFTEGTHSEPQKQTEIGPVPESWEVVQLRSLLREKLRNGHSARATNTLSGTRTLTLSAITQNDFSEKNTKLTCAKPERVSDLWLEPGDLFIERANTFDYVGLAALYNGPENYAVFPDLLVRVRVSDRILPKALAEYLLLPFTRNYFQRNAKGTAGNFPKIDQGTIENLPVVLPPLSIQKELESISMLCDYKLAGQKSRRDSLQDLFRTLLHQLMTAQIRVNDVDLSGLGLEIKDETPQGDWHGKRSGALS